MTDLHLGEMAAITATTLPSTSRAVSAEGVLVGRIMKVHAAPKVREGDVK
jgi:hypothetical protein